MLREFGVPVMSKLAPSHADRYDAMASRIAQQEARIRELEADAKRLDWLADDPPFDALCDMDIHETAFVVASEDGREEATAGDYRVALRRVIDAALDHAMTTEVPRG